MRSEREGGKETNRKEDKTEKKEEKQASVSACSTLIIPGAAPSPSTTAPHPPEKTNTAATTQ